MNYSTHIWNIPQEATVVRVRSLGASWDCPAWLIVVIVLAAVFLCVAVFIGIYVLLGGPLTPIEVEGIIHALRH
jgi:hypothetical protein